MPTAVATTRTRRRFLATAAGATVGAVATGVPMLARGATGPVSLRCQSAWPANDIFHEYALDYAKKVNDMTGGDLKIEMLPAGAVAPAFGLLDAVSKGVVDGGHGVVAYHYDKQAALALWGSGPAFGMDANMLLAWHRYGGGRDLLAKVYASLGANVVSYLYGPMPTQPLGWFKKPVTKLGDFAGLKFRTVGMSIDLYAAMGAVVTPLPAGEIVAAMSRGTIDAAEYNNMTSDRALGLSDVSPVCMLQSFHQNAEQFEILFNKDKLATLPGPMQAIVAHAVDAASADLAWKAIDRYSKDYLELRTRQKVRFYKTPDAVLQGELDTYDKLAARKAAENALFKEVADSQRAFAERAVRWDMDNSVNRRMAFNNYFREKGWPFKKS
ncbi:MAG: C4-dicarboxylate ABC transporter [Burkholderiales bacterium]|nr:C4-dicarboxylate ABC transporter [Burkholderiales bacterium]